MDKNNQKRQMLLWIAALAVGAVTGLLGIGFVDTIMNFIATVYTRLFQLLAVPTIALAVATTLAGLGTGVNAGRMFRHAVVYTLLTTTCAAAVVRWPPPPNFSITSCTFTSPRDLALITVFSSIFLPTTNEAFTPFIVSKASATWAQISWAFVFT